MTVGFELAVLITLKIGSSFALLNFPIIPSFITSVIGAPTTISTTTQDRN
jgi:hypothetical protein